MKKRSEGRPLEIHLPMVGSKEDHRRLTAEVPGTALFSLWGFVLFLLILMSIIILVC